VDLASSLTSMAALIVLLRFWQPPPDPEMQPAAAVTEVRPDGGHPLRAWIPWIALSVFVFAWSLPAVKNTLNGISAPDFPVPTLNGAVVRVPPVVPSPKAEEAIFKLNWLSATGTALLLAGVVTGFALGLKPAGIAQLYWRTLLRVRVSLLTIAVMLALGFTTRFSGSDTTMGLAFASTGWWFPFFSPLLGWLGVALTGSDTSSNVLFGNLQQVTAQQLGISPILTAAANSSGGVMGKMIDAQSIVVASVATSRVGEHVPAGVILRAVFWHSLALAALVGVWVTIQAYVLRSMVIG
jgi:lactate permease